MTHADLPFALHDATVERVHAALRDGSLTAVRLVRACLARIDACDRAGPALRAMVTLHPGALDAAARADALWRADPAKAGPLHGVPVVVKDNIETADLPTSGGVAALRAWCSARDASVVERLRAAGAIVLGKANLTELARGGLSVSAAGGQTLNPYDRTRTPGGSSGGTGAALAAGYAVVGVGSDTGQSVRSPASACALVGVRPTRGLVSRHGLMPNSFTQDELGPLARTAADAARLLGVMTGFDENDPVTALGIGHGLAGGPLDADALRGARIGVVTSLFGTGERHAAVNAVMSRAMEAMRAGGATLEPFEPAGFDALAARVSTDRFEAVAAFDAWLASLGAAAPAASLADLVARGGMAPQVRAQIDAELAVRDGLNDPDYLDRLRLRDRLRILIAGEMARRGLDAVLYPHQRILVVPVGAPEQAERNGHVSHGTGLPAVTFHAGFSAPTAEAPVGVPVGAELLGPDFSEWRLLSLAHAYERSAGVWRPPVL